jgi:signal transduction histidine kinase
MSLNLTGLYGSHSQFQILHPALNLDHMQIDGLAKICDQEPNQPVRNSCDGVRPDSMVESKREWMRHSLGESSELPESFLSMPPLVDPEGFSYAYFLTKQHKRPYNQKSWVLEHLSYFKLSELREVLKTFHIESPQYALISKLTDAEIEAVVRGSNPVITQNFLLMKDQSQLGFSPLNYWVYDLGALSIALSKGDYELVRSSETGLCLKALGDYCITYNSKHFIRYIHRYSRVLLVLFGLLLILGVGFYSRFLFERARLEQRRRLSVQILAHEFRTPVSSMLLLLEPLQKVLPKLGTSEQDALSRLSSEVYRLQRIIEVSKTYLQADAGRIAFREQKIESINAWISDVASELEIPVQLELLGGDCAVTADPFWLKILVINLLQNAVFHGAPPVTVRLWIKNKRLQITVKDHGTCEYHSLEDMSDAFVRRPGSQGMGLGLNIAKLVASEWGGELSYSNRPTSFTLSLAERQCT